ncbi:vWA domain-containing protein [Marinomonas spartinae]|uniref:vWA domain-containing protein n=1 Tax=Marinomonas spartinae TaxID=1792290 RepID=UPI0018F263F4|nr:vWA domain-containing protein [Marinomonas spartinae]MBJ7555126.1 VWA domain-containing protein [Marinomonas spartinae]
MKWFKVYAVLTLVVVSTWSSLSRADTQFRILVDASGSMQTSDPDRITPEAIQLLSQLAPEGKATIGVWLFGEQPRVLFPETDVTEASRVKLANYLKSYVTQDLKTDVESILDLLLKTPAAGSLKPGFRQDWILITDGNVDLSLDESVNQASRQRIWTDITKQLEERGIHLHTISLTGYSDRALLDHLSFRTNATHTEAAVPENMLDAFDRIFSQSMPYQELPLIDDHFKVDPSVSQISIESLHEAGGLPTIVQPNGKNLVLSNRSDVSVSEGPHFTVITITNPAVGEWHVDDVNLSRVKVRAISDLNLRVTKIAPVTFVNEPIHSTASLFRDDQALKGAQIPRGDVEQILTRLVGSSKEVIFKTDLDALKGRFKNRIEGLSQPGEYVLTTDFIGKNLDRKMSQYFAIRPPVNFTIKSSSDNLVTVSATPSNGKLDIKRSNVRLELTFADGTKQFDQMAKLKDGDWNKVIPVASNSNIKARARLIGFTQSGTRIEYWTPTWTIHRNGSDPVYVEKGSVASSTPPTSTVSVESEQNVAPVLVEPNVELVGNTPTTGNQQAANDTGGNNQGDDSAQDAETFGADSLLLYLGIAAGVVLLLAVIVFVIRRSRRRNRYDDFQDDDLDDV